MAWPTRRVKNSEHHRADLGAVAGAVVGKKAEKTATQKKAWELLVEMSGSGETLAIVQPADQTFDGRRKGPRLHALGRLGSRREVVTREAIETHASAVGALVTTP